MKVYVATFYGDLKLPPMVDTTLTALLKAIRDKHGFGEYNEENECYMTPDPEDDKIEIWEYDREFLTARIVWGFWGWHHKMPEDMTQGKMPNDEKSLYDRAMEDY